MRYLFFFFSPPRTDNVTRVEMEREQVFQASFVLACLSYLTAKMGRGVGGEGEEGWVGVLSQLWDGAILFRRVRRFFLSVVFFLL